MPFSFRDYRSRIGPSKQPWLKLTNPQDTLNIHTMHKLNIYAWIPSSSYHTIYTDILLLSPIYMGRSRSIPWLIMPCQAASREMEEVYVHYYAS